MHLALQFWGFICVNIWPCTRNEYSVKCCRDAFGHTLPFLFLFPYGNRRVAMVRSSFQGILPTVWPSEYGFENFCSDRGKGQNRNDERWITHTVVTVQRNKIIWNASRNISNTRWFKYDRDWFVCKQAALRSSCATLREWSHNLHPPSCSG